MKKKIINKSLLSFLTIVLALSFVLIVVLGSVSTVHAADDRYADLFGIHERNPEEQIQYDKLIKRIKTKQWFADKADDAKTVASILKSINNSIPGFVKMFKDAQNGGDFDTAACVETIVSTISNIAACCGPYGQLASSIIDIGNTVFKLIMGGESETSEMVQMEDRLNQQFDEIKGQLSNILDQISGISNQINESTNKIISAISTALDNADAKQYLRTFMLSGEGNFSYNQFRNYIYGATSGNSKSSTAYYGLLKDAITSGKSSETVKYYYDKLYSSIIENIDIYYDYIVGTNMDKSIVQYYYDVVSARPDLLDNGTSPELAAIQFAYDIYTTELMADELIMICNTYQYTQMLFNDEESYCYNQSKGDVIEASYIVGYTDENGREISMYNQIKTREDDIYNQLIKDIAYILKLSNSYLVKDADGSVYEIENNDPDTFGRVIAGQTIFLNKVSESVCDLFGIDADEFRYVISSSDNTEGVFTVNKYTTSITATLYYGDTIIDTINFYVGKNAKFNGGSGTANDPYLISSAAQFYSIKDGLDKHYRLIDDFDFSVFNSGNAISPIGYRQRESGDEVYEEFTGTLNGNGHTISNIKISGSEYTGLFCKVGETGEISDLKLYNIEVMSDNGNAKKTSSSYFAGIIAGENNGKIRYIEIDGDVKIDENDKDKVEYSSYLSSSVTNDQNIDRSIYVYAGGIAGRNNNIIACCILKNVSVSASDSHNFHGQDTDKSHNAVYVGGICGENCGYIGYSIVESSASVSASALSIYNPETTTKPYVTALAGGITANIGNGAKLENIKFVYSDAIASSPDKGDMLKSKSGWGKYDGNCKTDKNAYVPGYTDDQIKSIKSDEASITSLFTKSFNEYEIEFVNKKEYAAGSSKIDASDFELRIDGNDKDFTVLEIYGFNTQNESFEETMPVDLTVIIGFELDGKTVYLAKDVEITVGKNYLVSVPEILNLKDEYVKGTFTVEGMAIKYNYAVGEKVSYIEDASNVKIYGDINEYGKPKLSLEYDGKIYEYTITVICGHEKNFVESGLYKKVEEGDEYFDELSDEDKPRSTTCTEIGWDTYICTECGDIQKYYHRALGHTLAVEIEKDATCCEEGHIGKVYCSVCGVTLEEGYDIPKIPHKYEAYDEIYHICTYENCTDPYERHQYQVSESVKTTTDDNGAETYTLVYTYTCKTCGYVSEKKDENIITDEELSLPTVIVSDGYAVNGGDEVVVYVQLLNNPGIIGANFGIRYDEKLTLKEWEYGSLVTKSETLNDDREVNFGYNYVWGNVSTNGNSNNNTDGNLLKLVFKVPEDAVKPDETKLGEEFGVYVVYDMGGNIAGGFEYRNDKNHNVQECFITRDGTIKMVKRLPGDINNDGVVDILDAIEIGKFLVRKTTEIDETVANVDLSYRNDGKSNVSVNDMIVILQSITGGYGTNLINQEYKVFLNTNGYDIDIEDLIVSIYNDENSHYDDAGLVDLVRNGYKFLGWYTKLVDGDKVDLGSAVTYYDWQKKQTLYAHWELNEIDFDDVGTTGGEMKTIYYPEHLEEFVWSSAIEYVKQYDVKFRDTDKNGNDTINDTLTYYFDKWEGKWKDSNGEEHIKEYDDIDSAVSDLLNEHYGKITLSAKWKDDPSLTYPTWSKTGYSGVVWYWNSDTKDSDYIISHKSDVLNGERKLSAGKYHYEVYARFIPIEFYVKFDLNGGSASSGFSTDGDVNKYSVENEYKFVDANDNEISSPGTFFTKTGYKFNGWVDDFGNYYSFDTNTLGGQSSLLSKVNNDDTVTFTAQWTAAPIELKIYGLKSETLVQNDSYDSTIVATIYYCYGDAEHRRGYYKDRGLSSYIETLNDIDFNLSYDNFKIHGIYGKVDNNGHTYSTTSGNTYFFKDGTPNIFNVESGIDVKSGNIYAWCFPKSYKITFEAGNAGYGTTSFFPYIISFYYNEELPEKVTKMPTNSYFKAQYYYETTAYYDFDGRRIGNPIANFTSNVVFTAKWVEKNDYYKDYIYIADNTNRNDDLPDDIKIYTFEKILSDESGKYLLIENIDMSNYNCQSMDTFSGILDGGGNSILNWSYVLDKDGDNTYDAYGFIRTLTGEIKNVTFDNLNISIYKYKDGVINMYVGGVCGVLSGGTLSNVHIINSSIYGYHYRDVKEVNGSNNVGGVVKAQVGGFVGTMESGEITDCTVENVSVKGKASTSKDLYGYCHANVGGFVGEQFGGTIQNCQYSSVSVFSETDGGKLKNQYRRSDYIVGYQG